MKRKFLFFYLLLSLNAVRAQDGFIYSKYNFRDNKSKKKVECSFIKELTKIDFNNFEITKKKDEIYIKLKINSKANKVEFIEMNIYIYPFKETFANATTFFLGQDVDKGRLSPDSKEGTGYISITYNTKCGKKTTDSGIDSRGEVEFYTDKYTQKSYLFIRAHIDGIDIITEIKKI